MSLFTILRRRLLPSRRATARLAVLALLFQAALLAVHHPGAWAALVVGETAACVEQTVSAPTHHEDGAQHNPDLAAAHCPLCTLVQGGTLLPPSPCLIFPPLGPPTVLAPPVSERSPFPVLVAAHRPRGPPAEP
jgi:hypothetical protein